MSRGRDTDDRLNNILMSIGRIHTAEHLLSTAQEVSDHQLENTAFDAVLYNLVVIGEAVRALPTDLTDGEPDTPWRDISDMRNFLSHEYFRVSADIVHRTIDEPLGLLLASCRRLLDNHGETP